MQFKRRRVAIAAALPVLGAIAAVAVPLASGASAASVNRAPICNLIGFNIPAPGASVSIRVLDAAADPDRSQIRLVGVFGASGGTVAINQNGTPSNPDDDSLTYKRTAPANSVAEYLYWTVSDGQRIAQCIASAPGTVSGGGGG